jgi:hypothetical protein
MTALGNGVDDSGIWTTPRSLMTDGGFKSAWRRAMAKHIAAGSERFRGNAVRAKAASDADDLHAAQKLLAHESAATTQRHYRRGVAKIVPLK